MTVTLRSQVTAVTVYRKGAEVTRTATLEAGPDGFPETIRLSGLPLTLEDATVRVRLAGTSAFVRQSRVGLDAASHDDGLAPAEDEALEAARLHEAMVSARLEQRRVELGRVSTLRILPRPAGAKGERPPSSPVEGRLALLAFQAGHFDELGRDIGVLEKELHDASQARAELEERHNRATTARQPRPDELRKVLVLTISERGATAGSKAELEVRYRVPGARWAPSYQLTLAPDMKSGTLTLRAAIAQKSGEDWKGVALTTSTARAQDWHELPELASIRIGRRQAPKPSRWRAPPKGTDALFEDYDGARQHEPAPLLPPPPPSNPSPAPAFRGAARLVAQAEALDESAMAERSWDLEAPESVLEEEPMPPMAAPSVVGVLASAMKSVSRSRAPTGGGAPPREPPAPLEDVPDDALSNFGALRMRGPSSQNRGKLAPASQSETWEEMALTHGVERAQLSHLVGVASTQAQHVEALPRGHVPPAPEGGFDYAYPAEHAVDVASDGRFHSVVLRAIPCSFTPRFVSVPRESSQVFRVLEVKNPLDAALLAGPLDVTLGSHFLLATTVPETGPEGRLRLGLGVEQAVKVARNTSFREEGRGLVIGTLGLVHEVRVSVTNLREHAAEVEVRERIPVRKDKESDVKINDGPSQPAWQPWHPEGGTLEGGRAWTVSVAAGATMELVGHYTVVIPAKHEIVGGNRRER